MSELFLHCERIINTRLYLQIEISVDISLTVFGNLCHYIAFFVLRRKFVEAYIIFVEIVSRNKSDIFPLSPGTKTHFICNHTFTISEPYLPVVTSMLWVSICFIVNTMKALLLNPN